MALKFLECVGNGPVWPCPVIDAIKKPSQELKIFLYCFPMTPEKDWKAKVERPHFLKVQSGKITMWQNLPDIVAIWENVSNDQIEPYPDWASKSRPLKSAISAKDEKETRLGILSLNVRLSYSVKINDVFKLLQNHNFCLTV